MQVLVAGKRCGVGRSPRRRAVATGLLIAGRFRDLAARRARSAKTQ
jgi:hypothetical protein